MPLSCVPMPGRGVHHVPFDQTTRRRFVTLFGGAALTAATIAARAQSAAKSARQPAAKTPPANSICFYRRPWLSARRWRRSSAPSRSRVSRSFRKKTRSRYSTFPSLRRRKDSSSWISNRVRPSPTMRHMEEPMDRTQRRPNSKVSKKTWILPLGPLKTAHSEVMDRYKTIVDRYDGTVYRNMVVVELEGVASYNSYINHTPPFKWILHPNWYTTAGFRAKNNGMLGRSNGCITVDPVENNQLVTRLADGALIYVTVGDDPIEQYL